MTEAWHLKHTISHWTVAWAVPASPSAHILVGTGEVLLNLL